MVNKNIGNVEEVTTVTDTTVDTVLIEIGGSIKRISIKNFKDLLSKS